jgi:hypothetical protein
MCEPSARRIRGVCVNDIEDVPMLVKAHATFPSIPLLDRTRFAKMNAAEPRTQSVY